MSGGPKFEAFLPASNFQGFFFFLTSRVASTVLPGLRRRTGSTRVFGHSREVGILGLEVDPSHPVFVRSFLSFLSFFVPVLS